MEAHQEAHQVCAYFVNERETDLNACESSVCVYVVCIVAALVLKNRWDYLFRIDVAFAPRAT